MSLIGGQADIDVKAIKVSSGILQGSEQGTVTGSAGQFGATGIKGMKTAPSFGLISETSKATSQISGSRPFVSVTTFLLFEERDRPGSFVSNLYTPTERYESYEVETSNNETICYPKEQYSGNFNTMNNSNYVRLSDF